MKRNVVMVVVDAFFYDYVGKKSYKNSSTPFLDKLIKNKNSVSINKMYSQAPYTEAALMSLLGGCDTMDYGAYMKRLKNTDCLLNEFKKNGYTVFANCFQSSIYPSGALTGVNDIYYNSSFNFGSCWDYRIKYFSELNSKKKLNKKQYELIVDILEDNFKEGIIFLECLKNNDKKTEILYDKLDLSHVRDDLIFIKKEYEKFQKNNIKYINEIFQEKENHAINKLYTYPIVNKIDDFNLLNIIEKKYKSIFKKIFWKNFRYNLLNNRISLKKVNKLIKEKKYNILKSYIKSYISSFIDTDIMDRINTKTYNTIKTIPSAHTQFEHFKKWKNMNNKPFFAYLHIDDIHFREMFFTHDTKDLSILDKDFKYVSEYIKKLPKNYKGSLTYDLGVMYVDKQIEGLFEYLKKENLLDNTDIIITADHGNSYTYQNIRENFVINFYEENYHIPCIIYSNNIKFNINQKNFYQTKDIPATILEMENIKIPKSYTGNSFINFSGRDYVIAEYAGSGCPDIVNRSIQLNVRTNNYSLSGECFINDINTLKFKELYDLKNDAKENINIINNISNIDLNYEKELIINMIKDLQEKNKKILDNKE